MPDNYQNDKNNIFVLAKKKTVAKDNRELMLDSLLKLFNDSGIISDVLKDKIDKARKVRNTFHLAKSRKGIFCGIKVVNLSFEAVLETSHAVNDYLNRK